MKQLINSYNLLDKKVTSGVFNNINKFCLEKINTPKCQKFYDSLLLKDDGYYQCPYGFNCIKDGNEVHNCILLRENYINKKMQDKKNVEQKIFLKKEIDDIIKIDKENLQHVNNSELLYKNMSDFLHDITKVNKMIDKYSKAITKNGLVKKDISKLESIYHLSDFISKRIELYRMASNPEIIKTGRKRKRNAYQLWDIYRYIFNDFCKESELNIDMKIYNENHIEENDKGTFFNANDSITILPYLIIDNAVKYSREKSTIKVRFYQNNDILKKMTISSIPSYIIMEDPDKLIDRGYRAANNTSKSSGSGLGLNIANQICEYNDINLKIKIGIDESGKQKFVIILEIMEDSND